MRYYLHRQQTLVGRIQNWWAVRTCKHEINSNDIVRINPNLVEAECHNCGKKLTAAYGLALKAKINF